MVLGLHYNLAALGEGLSGFVVDLQDDVAVKIYLSGGLHEPRLHRDREAHFLRALADSGLVLPQYIAHGTHSDLREASIPILTMSRLISEFQSHENVIIGNLEDLGSLGDVIGRQVAKLHALTPARFPEDKQKSTLQTMLEQTHAFDVKAESRSWFYKSLAQKLEAMEQQVRPVFCHGDFHFGNIGFKPGTYEPESLIDFAYSGFGMLETDFIYLQEPELFEAAVAAYEEETGRRISTQRLQMVGLINNMRAMVTFEHYLAGELSDEDRENYQEERTGAYQDILDACDSLGVINFVFAGAPPPP